MKFLLSAMGLGIAWSIYTYAPTVFPVLTGLNGFISAISGICGVLTAVWAINLARLSVFEKLDDLSRSQKEVVIRKAGRLRQNIIFSMITNTLLLVVLIISVNLLNVPALNNKIIPWIGYLSSASLAYWIAGFVESWFCWVAIDESRLGLAAAQSTNRQRSAYLEKLRDDEAKAPISRIDAHMNAYTEDVRPSQP